ncbi:hypothetical protein Tco_0246389 [Tanacetum coccineum]
MRINDYRPISCCNVLYKRISRIISNRMKDSLSSLVSLNQSTFVPGRRISDHILLTQELMHNYHLDRSTPRCAFKVDIQKAYDTVDWKFLKDVLIRSGFHLRMTGWIMECVTSTSFSLSINGNLHGYFKGKRGLRQGHPMSPYLFTLVMEVLTLMLHWQARDLVFTYHRYCSKLNIINLCFADDLFLFAHGDVESAWVIMNMLEEFKNASGLTPSLPKSTTYFCNVLNHVKLDILQILPFEEGKLPIKYLGVPLVPSRLLYRDCMELMEKVKRRINDWKNKSISLTRRAQLIHSVLGSTHGFLWCQCEMRRGKAKVAWEDVCLPRKEGGLDIRQLEVFNKALIATHISRDGVKSSSSSPLADFISNRDIYRAGLSLTAKVNEIIEGGTWCWPPDWISRYPSLANVIVPNISTATDGLIPRHAIHLWLVMRHKLKTQDTLRQWDVSSNTNLNLLQCPLCGTQPDSHDHFLLAKIRSTRSVVSKLVFAASNYFIWQERNNRLFMMTSRSRDQVINIIKSNVRLKLLTCKFKKTKNDSSFYLVHGLKAGWKVECSPRAVLFFPSVRFFLLGFSWEGFLRRHYRLACITPMVLHNDGSGDLCTIKWFFPIGVIVYVSVSYDALWPVTSVTKDEATMAWRCRACDDLVKDYLCVPFPTLLPPDEGHCERMYSDLFKVDDW